MPAITYKISDVERNAVSVQEQRPDTMDEDADISKGWFDTYPDLIKTKLNGLCDYIVNMPTYFESSADTAAPDKGTIPSTSAVPIGSTIALILSNGNTAVSPTLTVEGVPHSITGMPAVAKLSTSANQSYLLRRTGAATLAVVKFPDYVCEYGTSGTFKYARYASGEATLRSVTATASGTLTMTQVSTSGIYISALMTLTLPTGLFNNANYAPNFSLSNTTYVVNITPQYGDSTNNLLKYMVQKGGSSTSEVSFRVTVDGTWY